MSILRSQKSKTSLQLGRTRGKQSSAIKKLMYIMKPTESKWRIPSPKYLRPGNFFKPQLYKQVCSTFKLKTYIFLWLLIKVYPVSSAVALSQEAYLLFYVLSNKDDSEVSSRFNIQLEKYYYYYYYHHHRQIHLFNYTRGTKVTYLYIVYDSNLKVDIESNPRGMGKKCK